MAIGLAAGRPFSDSLREDLLQLQQGDVLLLYTDGLTEAVKDEEAYGEARLYASMLTHLERQPQAMIDASAEDVSRWAGGPVGDDVTLLTLTADAVPARTPSEPGLAPSGAASSARVRPPSAVFVAQEAEPEVDTPEAVAEDQGSGSQPSETGEIQAQAAT